MEKNFYELGLKAKKFFLYDAAIKFLKKSAESKNPAAMYELGDIFQNEMYRFAHLYKENEGVAQNNVEALKWYERAAAEGFKKSFIKIALMYKDEEDIERDEKKSKKYFKAAVESYTLEAESGNGFSMKILGDIYENYSFREKLNYGEYPMRKNNQSDKWYKMAFKVLKNISEKNIDAMFEIANMYFYGKGTKADAKKAMEILEKISEIGGDDEKIIAYKKIAEIFDFNRNSEEKIKFLKKAADLDDIEAIRILVSIFRKEKNISEAEKLLKKSDEIQENFLNSVRE